MKKILLLIASAAIALAVNAAPQKVDFGKLPKNSQEFIQKNFPGEKVKAVEMDREASWDKYTVYFNSGNQDLQLGLTEGFHYCFAFGLRHLTMQHIYIISLSSQPLTQFFCAFFAEAKNNHQIRIVTVY